MASTEYLLQVRRLLHDANAQYWTDSELLDDINQARNRIALDSGCIRTLFNFFISAGQEAYPYQGAVAAISVTAAGSGYTASPSLAFSGGGGSGATATASISNGTVSGITITANGSGYTSSPAIAFSGGGGSNATATATIMTAFDIMNITTNWGNSWITLAYTYFTEFQAKARFYRNVSGQPAIWSQGPAPSTGGGKWFYIFQIPSASYQCDIDATILPNSLVDDTTPEQIPYPYTDCVQYFAAYLAKYKQQEFNEATNFLRIYDELMRRGSAAKYQRRIPNPYGGI